MAAVTGALALPASSKKFSTALDFVIDYETVNEGSELVIISLPEDSSLCGVEIIVSTAFVSTSSALNSISISGSDGTSLMPANYNNPNMISSYYTDCNWFVQSGETVIVTHDITDALSGYAVIRLLFHNVSSEFEAITTVDGATYTTGDDAVILVAK